jgi:hypothetical protein
MPQVVSDLPSSPAVGLRVGPFLGPLPRRRAPVPIDAGRIGLHRGQVVIGLVAAADGSERRVTLTRRDIGILGGALARPNMQSWVPWVFEGIVFADAHSATIGVK